MRISIYKNYEVKWAWCGCGNTPLPVINEKNGVWRDASSLIDIYDDGCTQPRPLRWSKDYPKVLATHKAMGGGEVINSPERPLYLADTGSGYNWIDPDVEVKTVDAPPFWTYDHASYFEQ